MTSIISKKTLAITAIVLVAVIMGMSAVILAIPQAEALGGNASQSGWGSATIVIGPAGSS